jgi:hypothetical protein
MDTVKEDSVVNMMVLDAIRHLGNRVPHPVSGNWTGIQRSIEGLYSQGLLSIDSDHYEISKEGKKTILLFKDTINSYMRDFEAYKEVNVDGDVIDARVPILAFSSAGKAPLDEVKQRLLILALCTNWEFLISQIKRLHESGQNWQSRVADGSIFMYIDEQARPSAWLKLGKNPREAARTASLLLNPAQDNRGLIQIKRNA